MPSLHSSRLGAAEVEAGQCAEISDDNTSVEWSLYRVSSVAAMATENVQLRSYQ